MSRERRKIYVAVKHVPRTAPEIDWTKSGIAKKIRVHRNSLVFDEGMTVVKGWLIYCMEIETRIASLRRG